jgi:hypothetical protein
MQKLDMEAIFGGKTGEAWKEAGPQAGQVGEYVVKYFKKWDTVKEQLVYSKPESVTDKENVFWKLSKVVDSKMLSVSPHFTTALPLSGIASILDLVAPAKAEATKSALVPRKGSTQKLALVMQKQIEAAWPVMKDETTWKTPQLQLYGQETTRGFLIMVLSYVNKLKGAPATGDTNLKTRTPVMPQTDFTTMLHITLDTMSTAGVSSFKNKLKYIVFLLAGGEHALDTLCFRWVDDTKKPTDPGYQQELRSDAWIDELISHDAPIDLIRVNDIEFREAQVGALKNIVSSIIGEVPATAEHFCPVFEFRDMGGGGSS